MRAGEFIGTSAKRSQRAGSRPARGHVPLPRYKKLPAEQEQIDELTFLGSECTLDCSGHRAGYEWSQQRGGQVPNSWSPSFDKGAALHRAGK
jgi:hypothetical protein